MNDKREDSDRDRPSDWWRFPSGGVSEDGQGNGQRSWSRVISLTRKEIRQLLRDPGSLALGIGLPIALILIFGFGLSLDVRDAPVAVVLEDPSPTAADVIAGLELSTYIKPTVVSSMHDAERLMLAREVDAIVRIPNDFSRRLSAGDATAAIAGAWNRCQPGHHYPQLCQHCAGSMGAATG